MADGLFAQFSTQNSPPLGLGHINSLIRVRVLSVYEMIKDVRKQGEGVHLSLLAACARM